MLFAFGAPSAQSGPPRTKRLAAFGEEISGERFLTRPDPRNDKGTKGVLCRRFVVMAAAGFEPATFGLSVH